MIENNISDWLKNYLTENNLKCFVVGVSGGIDSALTSTLCAKTGIKTIVLSMPIRQKEDQLERAENHILWLKDRFKNVISFTIDLTNTFDSFDSLFETKNNLASANSRSRLRMMTLYQVAGIYNGLVVGTGNKIEDFGVGFFTKYGDGGVDISPIADLTKTEVRNISRKIGILESILDAAPTDGLWDEDRTDEEQLGASYEELEWAMEYNGDAEKLEGREKLIYEIYSFHNKKNKHKMSAIPIFKK